MGTISILTILSGVFTLLSTLGVVILTWLLKVKSDRDEVERNANVVRDVKINDLEKAFISAENKYVTNTQLKSAIREAFEPYKEDNKEIKIMLRNVSEELVNISRDLAIINAIGGSNGGTRNNGSNSGGTN